MTDEQRARRIKGLLQERADRERNHQSTKEVDEDLLRYGYGRDFEIDEELKVIGAEGKPPVKRATRRKRSTQP